MQTATVRISLKTREKLRLLTDSTGESMQSILDKAVDEISRKIFWERTNSAYATLKKDTVSWKKEQEERSILDIAIADGLKE
jgi:hypothetical protein